ncbi:HCLS1-associated protein X-1 [Alosa sapidissima]|uniref:HCLS1-associated protein X-1 n=1 Tax=Alosa sapidissima TaxID=34773 RepID=UPI001C088C73|nr:HCLS1-associated protein X-1 [Alosa sapidissima]
MSIFDLFRGFFGVPGGTYGRYGPREPFFDSMTHDEDDDEEDEREGFYPGSFEGPGGRDPLDDAWRFGFSMGPNGMRLHEPPMFGQILREMEDIFSELGRWEDRHGPFGMPSLEPPHPPQGRGPCGESGDKNSSLRDFMLKCPDDRPSPSGPPPPGAPPDSHGPSPDSPFQRWSPFSKFHDSWRDGLFGAPLDTKKEDGDLDSQVSSGGLDQILTPAPAQPRTRSFFQSVTVKKIVKPDGSVEETRTVRDGQGNEETTVTRSGGSGGPEGSRGPNGGPESSTDLQDNMDLFSKFFGGFRG